MRPVYIEECNVIMCLAKEVFIKLNLSSFSIIVVVLLELFILHHVHIL